MDRARTREAARMIHVYLNSARNLAMAQGRSVGVMIERLPSNNGAALTLSQVEMPPVYAGDIASATATVTITSSQAVQQEAPDAGIDLFDVQLTGASPNLDLQVGDQIRFNYQGPWYTIRSVVPNDKSFFRVQIDTRQGLETPWSASGTSGNAYQIQRWPTKSVAAPLQLPSPAAIDLTASGPDQESPKASPVFWSEGSSPVTIMFAPDGTVESVSAHDPSTGKLKSNRILEPVYFLVGTVDHVGANASPRNIDDGSNFCIAVDPRTGLVSIADMAATHVDNVYESRKFARRSDMIGGS